MPNKGWSIRHRLMLLALAVALPFMLLTAGHRLAARQERA